MPKVSLISNSEEETKLCAHKLAGQLKAGDIVFLQGELGSGKTTFVKGLAQAFKVNSKKVNSPTFVLMNYYKGKLPIYHFDLYRLGSAQEIDTLDFDDYLYGPGITVIEWPERLEKFNIKPDYLVKFKHKLENERLITISHCEGVKRPKQSFKNEIASLRSQ